MHNLLLRCLGAEWAAPPCVLWRQAPSGPYHQEIIYRLTLYDNKYISSLSIHFSLSIPSLNQGLVRHGCQMGFLVKNISTWRFSEHQNLTLCAKFWYLEGLQRVAHQLKFEDLQLRMFKQGVLAIKWPNLVIQLTRLADLTALSWMVRRLEYSYG